MSENIDICWSRGTRGQWKLVEAPVTHLRGSDRGQALLLVKDAEWRGVASPGPTLEGLLLNTASSKHCLGVTGPEAAMLGQIGRAEPRAKPCTMATPQASKIS